MTEKVTAGHDNMVRFAPKFAELNDDVLFGQVWSREAELSARDRSLTTITALISAGAFEQLPFHMAKAKDNGLTADDGRNYYAIGLLRWLAKGVVSI